MDRKSLILFIAQVLLVLFIILTGPLLIKNIPFLLVQFFGWMLIGWAILAKHLTLPKERAALKDGFIVMKGPYEIIRHPIYAGILLIMSGSVQGYGEFLRYLGFFLLIIATVVKMNHEEQLLKKHSKEYVSYTAKTHKLIPYFY